MEARKKSRKRKLDNEHQDSDQEDQIKETQSLGEVTDDTNESNGTFYKQFVKPSKKLKKEKLKSNDVVDERKPSLDLDKVFAATNGVTCHRSAHVGLTLSGKMKRLQAQESSFKKGTSKK